jgi:hypothetical protein
MKLVFIYGYPGVGKLTVATELQKLTNYKLFHNHLAVDLVEPVFEFGSKPFIELREEIWLRTFELGIQNGLEGMIFTFAFEKTVSVTFIDKVIALFSKDPTNLMFVELICEPSQLKSRVENPDRQKYGKFQSFTKLDELINNSTYFEPELDAKVLKIDNTHKQPDEVSREIVSSYSL